MVKVLEMLQEHRDESLGLQCFSNCSIMEIIGALNECTNDIVDPEIRNNLVLEIYQMDGPEGCFPHGQRCSSSFVWDWIQIEAMKSPDRKANYKGRLPNDIFGS